MGCTHSITTHDLPIHKTNLANLRSIKKVIPSFGDSQNSKIISSLFESNCTTDTPTTTMNSSLNLTKKDTLKIFKMNNLSTIVKASSLLNSFDEFNGRSMNTKTAPNQQSFNNFERDDDVYHFPPLEMKDFNNSNPVKQVKSIFSNENNEYHFPPLKSSNDNKIMINDVPSEAIKKNSKVESMRLQSNSISMLQSKKHDTFYYSKTSFNDVKQGQSP